jgi:hypothetical protein
LEFKRAFETSASPQGGDCVVFFWLRLFCHTAGLAFRREARVPLTVDAAAGVLLLPHTVRTVADILALPAWPAEQLRLVVKRWQPDVEVRIERIR